MEPLTGEEIRAIDGVIDYWEKAGVPLSGVNFDNPIVMNGIRNFFRKIGKGIKNVAQKIKQRIRERNIQANIQTDQGSYSLGPQGATIATPTFNVTTERALTEARYPGKFEAKFDQSQEVQQQESKPNYMLIGGAVAAIALIVMMGKK